MIWDGTETCVVVRNRRSETLWKISLALKQIRNYRGEGPRSWTVVRYGKVSLGSLQQAKILLEWEGPPIGLGIGYEREPDNPRSRDYELPEDFRRDWPNLGPNARSWKFPPWDPGAEIEGNVRAEVLALPPGHPYLRLPLQFATALEERLVRLLSADELAELRERGEAELQEPGRFGHSPRTEPVKGKIA